MPVNGGSGESGLGWLALAGVGRGVTSTAPAPRKYSAREERIDAPY